jgi:hypothetical protein
LLNIIAGLALLFTFVLSFGIGYIIGSGKIVFNQKLSEEEKKEMKEFQKQVSDYNNNINEWSGFGDVK